MICVRRKSINAIYVIALSSKVAIVLKTKQVYNETKYKITTIKNLNRRVRKYENSEKTMYFYVRFFSSSFNEWMSRKRKGM